MHSAPRVAVVLASAGRPELLNDVIADLARQTISHSLVLSVPDPASLPSSGAPEHAVVVNARGLAAQRNAGLDAIDEADYVFFFDDDAVVRDDYLERGVEFFADHPEFAGLTGNVLADGASSEQIPRDASLKLLAESDHSRSRRWQPSRELYGCNFAYRVAAAPFIRFDGRLPLYSWLEDHDFARRLMRHGLLARVDDCVIVHRGVKSGGRTAHTRLGYSQFMNPFYLHHSGSFPLWLTLHEVVWRCGKNAVRSVVGSERAWRRERLRGNLIALGDVLRARFTPERMTEFS